MQQLQGLTSQEVEQRVQAGKVNISANIKTKSIGKIFYDNICTLFNLINVILFVSLLLVGSFKNLLFIGVVFFNTIIGIVQEIRSKRSVDKLTILTDSKIRVMRDGEIIEIAKQELVVDDVIILSRGEQIPADCSVIDGDCKVNESLLTGESDLIAKQQGDSLLSGSFITSGKCFARVEKVGEDCYAAKINNEAKYVKKNNSQILRSFKFIIKLCTIIIFPIGALLFASQFFIQHNTLQDSVIGTVAGLVGMIPGGMILLTSTVLAVSIIRLSKKKVLVNEMYCIETLSRVDVLCLDKTGTLTADSMHVDDIISLGAEREETLVAFASLVKATEEPNATVLALADYTKNIMPLNLEYAVQFSSETKWSGGHFSNGKGYVMGAVEFLFPDRQRYKEVYDALDKITGTVRVLALASTEKPLTDALPQELTPMAFVLIKDTLRENVCDTVRFFREQGVTLKVISGDNVKTVGNIAAQTGIPGADRGVDMTTITTDEELEYAAQYYNIFGRVTPAQKKKLILALKKHGHTVAMTGDGVNDVLALKEADCSVAMASGSEAARNVSQLVLVNNDFSAMPQVVAEGRRTINNIERSSSLYLVKTIYSILLSVFFIFSGMTYPFEPIQLTLIGALTIGFPSFVLALQPNHNIVRGNFTRNIIFRALPAAICVVLNIILSTIFCRVLQLSAAELSTVSVYVTALSCFLLVLRLSLPLNKLRTAMLVVSLTGLVIAFIFFGKLFSLTLLTLPAMILLIVLSVVTFVAFNLMYNIADYRINRHKNTYSNS